ncbi:hypothetical protein GGR56DRAFT_691559 [Xylariaceae sp. FL0804]|nr:hypothetical protein GGR56DRAFT_691559 [Xylariaceae sp. FL0804]
MAVEAEALAAPAAPAPAEGAVAKTGGGEEDQHQQLEELYQRERALQTREFRGKRAAIAAQHAVFWQQEGAAADVAAYAAATPEHVFRADGGPAWLRAKTPFTAWAGPVLGRSSRAALIANRSSFDVAQYAAHPAGAGMSAVHLLAIPIGDERIFNGVALRGPAQASIIEHMAGLFRASWASPAMRRAVLAVQAEAVERRAREAPDEAAAEAARAHWRELEPVVEGLEADDFQFGLHLWPDNSVAHLHMHIIAAPEICRKYSTGQHDAKTKDAFEVYEYIKGLKDVSSGQD